jgi:hypothetical protein
MFRDRIGVELLLRPQQPGESAHEALQRAFAAVRWADPQIRQQLLDGERKAERAEAQRKLDIAKAKAAGRMVKSKTFPGSERPSDTKTRKEELERAWDHASA